MVFFLKSSFIIKFSKYIVNLIKKKIFWNEKMKKVKIVRKKSFFTVRCMSLNSNNSVNFKVKDIIFF
jgi:hypothetical protein